MQKRASSSAGLAAHPCGACRFGAASIWQPVADGFRGVLARSFLRRPLAAHEAVYEQGAANDAVYCLSQGMVALRSYRADGGSALVRLVYPGDIFGFRSFLAEDGHQTEAAALIPSRVCVVARREARQIITGSPQTLERIARRCADELATARDWQRTAVKTDNHKRLARLIVQISEGQTPDTEGLLRLPLSRQDMAAALGIEPETVSRLLGRLRTQAGLDISGRLVDQGSLDRLRKVG